MNAVFRVLAPTLIVLSGSATVVAADAADPCALLTKAEVEQALGPLDSLPRPQTNDRLRTCDYLFRDSKQGLSVWLFPGEATQRARKQIKKLVAVNGLGDEAFTYFQEELGYTELMVKKGDRVLQVGIPKAPGAEAKVQALARKALARLP